MLTLSFSRAERLVCTIALSLILISGALWGLNARAAAESAPPTNLRHCVGELLVNPDYPSDVSMPLGRSGVLPALGEQGSTETPPGGMSSVSTEPAPQSMRPHWLGTQQSKPHPSILSPDALDGMRELGISPAGRPTGDLAPDALLMGAHALDQEGFVVDLAYNAVWGFVNPGDQVTVARDDGAYGAAVADGVGFVWTPVWLPTGQPAEVAGGGDVDVFVNGSLETTIAPVAITAYIDVLEDQVVGSIAGDTGGTSVAVTLARLDKVGHPQAHAVTEESGAFTATFPDIDLAAWDMAWVSVAAGEDSIRGYAYPEGVFFVTNLSSVRGYAAPRQTVDVTVYVGEDTGNTRWTGSETAWWPHGSYFVGGIIEPGDLIEVDLGGEDVLSMVAKGLTAHPDAALDQVTGTGPPLETMRVWVERDGLGTGAEATAVADPTGHFTATFDGFDLRASHWVEVSLPDELGNETTLTTMPPNISNYPWSGQVFGYVDGPQLPVTVTLDTGTEILTEYVESGVHNVYFANFGFQLDAGTIITVSSPSWAGAMTVPELSFDIDTQNDQLLGRVDTPGWALGAANQQWNGLYPAWGSAVVSTTVAPEDFTLTFTDFDIRDGIWASTLHFDANDFYAMVWRRAPHFEVQPPYGVAVREIAPPTTVTGILYEADGETIKQVVTRDEMEPWGGYWLDFADHIVTGDWITVTADSWTAGLQVPELSLHVDEAANLVLGQGPEDRIYVQVGDWPDWVRTFVPGSDFVVDTTSFGQQLAWGDPIWATYVAPDGNTVHSRHEWPQIYARYDMDGHNAVFGHGAIPGNEILIAVTHPTDGIIATGSTTGGECDWCGPTDYSHELPQGVLTPGVTVTVDFGDQIVESVEVVAITGDPDPETNIVTGTAPPESRLNVNVHRNGEWAWAHDVSVDANGDYTVDFGALGWDIQPGDWFHAYYHAPRGHFVEAVFWEPTPRLRVEKWLEGEHVGEGGNAVFRVHYRNEGDGAAEDVVITDTLQGMTYLDDSSGIPPSGGGAQVTWELGTVEPGDWVQFYLFAEVTTPQGEVVTNTAEIATTSYDRGEEWEKRSQWSGQVVANDTRLNVGKWAWTGDPAAGYDLVFDIGICNNGSTGSAEVTLTDTLHVSMTVESWWSDYPGWTEVSTSAHELVVTKPSIRGWHCESVYVRATVDGEAWPGMELWNQAVVSASNDLEPDHNETWWHGHVGEPRTNLRIHKGWGHGQLVPGGQLHYWIDLHNNGNLPIEETFHITDTLPVSTTFQAAWRHDHDGQHAVTPFQVGDGYVVWEFSGLDNGHRENFEVVLTVDAEAEPGTELVNTAEVTCLPGEETCDDNVSSSIETLFDHGPNLRVRKYGDWHGHGEGRNAWYRLHVENVGDETVDDATVTDHYPPEMVLDSGPHVGYWEWWDWEHHPDDDSFTVTLDRLEPGWMVHIDYDTRIPGEDPVPLGLVLTNTAGVTLVDDDTNPEDNSASVVLGTGPDLYVEKSLIDGELLPGELITFSLAYGNDQPGHAWWWNMHGGARVEDTLPAELEYVSADPAPDVQVGGQLFWFVGQLHAGASGEILLTAQIADSATGLDTFINHAKISSDKPEVDIEPFYDNNEAHITLPVQLPHFEVSKAYQSSRVAGMPVRYTLTVTNTGNSDSTGVVLTDTLPTGVTFSESDGSHADDVITWDLGEMVGQGGTATGWFSGILPCTLGSVSNHDYGVASEEGVTAAGTPVTLDVQAPVLVADFEVSSTSVVEGTAIQFADTSTTDGPAIETWAWDFGDGETSSEQHPSHTYTAPGEFIVELTVTDSCGFTDVATSTVTVTAEMWNIHLPLVVRNHP